MFALFDDDINSFIKKFFMAVIATVDGEGQPSTSTIFYVLARKDVLHFMTKAQTIKSANLKSNSKVALSIVDKKEPVAVNLVGSAVEVTDPSERDEIITSVSKVASDNLQDLAPIVKLDRGGFQVYKLTPASAVMTDFTKPMGAVKEDKKKF